MDTDEDTHTHTHTTKYTEKIKILPFAATWMDSEGMKWNKPDRERQRLYDITFCMEFKKYSELVNIMRKKQAYRYSDQTGGY